MFDVSDEIPPGPWGDSLYAFEVSAGGRPFKSVRFDQLPDESYLKGVDEVYRVEPFVDLRGATVSNQIELDKPRHFLFHAPFDTARFPAGKIVSIAARAVDYAGNASRIVIKLALP